MNWYVYILKCSDESYYVGHTEDLNSRIQHHSKGLGSQHTASRLPVEYIYSESLPSKSDAMKRETQLKHWSRAKKEALIQGNMAKLRNLSKSRD